MTGLEFPGAAMAASHADAVVKAPDLPATPPDVLAVVRALEEISLRQCAQAEIPTDHLFHAGMYARTIEMAPGLVLTGALMKRATILIVCGRCKMLAAQGWAELHGHHVLAGAAGRKQVFESIDWTWITMLFPTQAKTVEEAEAEFTDEAEMLLSRRQDANTVTVTGE